MISKFQMCKQTNVIDEQLKDEIDFILNSLKTRKKIEILKNTVGAADLSHFHTRVCVCQMKANEIVCV